MFERIFAALNDAGVRYVVVGGVAVVLHGHLRLTVDLDLVIDLEPSKANEAIDALLALNLRPRLPVDAHDFADAATRREWASERNLRVFSFMDPADPLLAVDLFIESPFPFEAFYARSVPMQLQTTTVRIASIEDLMNMKREVGRPQDLADIDALQGIIEANDDT